MKPVQEGWFPIAVPREFVRLVIGVEPRNRVNDIAIEDQDVIKNLNQDLRWKPFKG